MNKKILLSLGALLAVVAGVAGFSAWEAHVINVTAHIENALTTHSDPIHFGTVFPQEYLTDNFTVSLSDSFISSQRADYVTYKIVQKPKCDCDYPQFLEGGEPNSDYALCTQGQYAAVGYATHECPVNYSEMKNLCEFLSKLPASANPDGEVGVPSYFNPELEIITPEGPVIMAGCETPINDLATGMLKGSDDTSDEWIVDLKVPPVKGYIGQDWPASCADWVVPVDGADYGCDLWLEVTCIGDAAACEIGS